MITGMVEDLVLRIRARTFRVNDEEVCRASVLFRGSYVIIRRVRFVVHGSSRQTGDFTATFVALNAVSRLVAYDPVRWFTVVLYSLSGEFTLCRESGSLVARFRLIRYEGEALVFL